MKLKKHVLSALVAALSLVLVFAFVACGGNKDPKVTAIELNPKTVEVETENTVKLTATATYDDETTAELKAGDVEWSSDKPDIATVTRGVVSGKAQGT
ncbi:MAG: Ig-like domain-containing protein, partial [Clostridia bacterium]|nr:Ig-like domain-containing protein [Clostridia bacterium]